MKIVDIPGGQGGEAWHQHRRDHWNASDAPAMMGCSPYQTRSQLLHAAHTGIEAEYDEATKRRFADGHRAEALARPLAEELLGEPLYPLVKANGRLSASLDGETLMGDVDWEHKALNEELRSAIPVLTDPPICPAHIGKALPLHYRVQIAHQQHCSGAQRTLFTASKWDAAGELIEARHCWVGRDEELIARVVAAWAQFEADLATYTPVERAAVVVAAPLEHLPAVSVQVQGALAVVSNLDRWGIALRAFIEKMPAKPTTDQEFADTDAACKKLKEAEERLQAAEDGALASMASVETMRTTVATLRELARTTRLASEKLVAARKLQIREEEVARGRREFATHFQALTQRLGGPFLPPLAHDFGTVIKGLKTLDSVRNAIDTEVARLKIASNEQADKIAANLETIDAAGAPTLFPDKAAIALKAADDVAALIEYRLTAERRRQEQERERIRAEEAARMLRQQEFEAARLRASTPPATLPATLGTGETPAAGNGEAPQITTNAQETGFLPGTPGTYASNAPQAAQGAPSGSHGPAAHAEERAADTRPPIKLSEIKDRIWPIQITEEGLRTLGINSIGKQGPATMYEASALPRICAAMVRHLQSKAGA